MHAIDFLRNPSKIPARPVYAVFGDDAFLRREVLEAIGRAVLKGEGDGELGITRFAGDQASLADVLDEVRTRSFFSKHRVVIVEGADPFVTAHRKELEAYVEHPSEAGTLVLSVKSWPSNTRLAKLVDKGGLAVECKGPPEKDLVPWLVHLSRSRYETPLDEDAARLLVELVGPEVGLLASEVEKLSVYVGRDAKIRRDDVARMVGAGRIETIWKVLDAATTGRGDLALELLDRLLAAGEHPVGLVAAMGTSLLKLHHAGRLRRARMRLEDACREAGIPPYSFAVEKTQQQHAHLGPRRVDQIPAMLLKADLDLKGSSMLTPRAVVEGLLVQLSRARQD
jgi:DNA polymerase-3 subunit delta